jgi:hypothetical protein
MKRVVFHVPDREKTVLRRSGSCVTAMKVSYRGAVEEPAMM